MINLETIRKNSALPLLEDYNGKNPYITNLRKKYIKHGKITLTTNQSKYIRDNFDKDPIKINRVLNITNYLGIELQKNDGLSFTPEKILVEYILAETEKTFHIYGKLKKNQEISKLYWIPKTQLLDDPYFEDINVEVNFEKYNTILSKFNKKLFKHQEEAVKFLLSRNGCILADDMGLGKTMSSIVASLESGAEKILIVCPSSLKINWEREINIFCDDTIIINGKKWGNAKFTIINYDILKNFHKIKKRGLKNKNIDEDVIVEFKNEMVDAGFDLVIVDEAHSLKNHKSIRGEIMVDLCVKHNVEKVWLLTGTPIANRPMDFFNLLNLIKAPVANNWQFFATRYCDGKRFMKTLKNGKKKQIWLTNGNSNLEELANKTKNIILRRKKMDVLDMPEKTIIPVYHQLSSSGRNKYENLWEEYLQKRKESGKRGGINRDLVELILLRQNIAMESIPYTVELAQNAIEQGEKVIIFTNFTEELLELQSIFNKTCVVHYGELNDKQKQRSIDRFQDDPDVKIFIGNIKSAGVGITLTAANIVIFNSYEWVPGLNEQAEDRSHRIGQLNNVSIYYQLFLNTISIRIWSVLQNKKSVIDKILGEKCGNVSDEEIIDVILELIEND